MEKTEKEIGIPYNDFIFGPKTEWWKFCSPFLPDHPVSIILFFPPLNGSFNLRYYLFARMGQGRCNACLIIIVLMEIHSYFPKIMSVCQNGSPATLQMFLLEGVFWMHYLHGSFPTRCTTGSQFLSWLVFLWIWFLLIITLASIYNTSYHIYLI